MALLNSSMNHQKDPHPRPLGEEIRIPALFFLGKRAVDEGKSWLYSAMPKLSLLSV
jgi:hypothetical protein